MRVPVRLWEWYWVHDVPERDRYVEGEASYDDFRRYTTDVGVPVVNRRAQVSAADVHRNVRSVVAPLPGARYPVRPVDGPMSFTSP